MTTSAAVDIPTTTATASPSDSAAAAAVVDSMGATPSTDAPEQSGAAAAAESGGEAAAEQPSKLARALEAAARIKDRNARRKAAAEDASRARADADRATAQLAQERAARERAEAAQRAFDEDPIGTLRKRGVADKDIEKVLLEQNTPQAQVEKLRAELAEERRARETWIAEERARASTATYEQIKRQFITEASDAAAFPFVAGHARVRESFLVSEAIEVSKAVHAKTGSYPTNKAVLEYLEWQYSEADKARNGGEAGARAGEAGGDAAEKPKQGGAKTAPGARTLTSKTGARATVAPSFDELDPDDQIPVMARMLRESHAR